MVGEVIMNGRIFNAIVIEPTIDARVPYCIKRSIRQHS